MRTVSLNLPTFALIIGTRAALAGGISLLLSDKLPETRRRAIGTALFILGAATTIPAAISVVRSLRRTAPRSWGSVVSSDRGLVGASRFPRKGDDDVTI
jgi:hypothetical protein